jgi:hypothetical protein
VVDMPPLLSMLKKLFLTLILILIFILNSSYLFSENLYILNFIDYKSNKNLFSFLIKENDTFCITYIHSVALTKVYEFYKIKNGKILLYEFHFYDQCAGLPTEAQENETLILENGVFKLKNMKREFEKIIYGIYEKGSFTLVYKNKTFNLSNLFGNRFLKIEIRRL